MNQGNSGDDGAARGGRPLRTWIVVALLSLAGAAASLAGFVFVNRWSTERAEAAFRLAAQERIAAVRREIGVHFEALYALGSLFDSSSKVDQDEFRTFATATLGRNPGLSGLGYVRRVPASQREQAERELGRPLLEQTADGDFRTAGERDVYYPFWFIHAADGLASPAGIDVAAEPHRAAALERAIRTGRIELTGPLRIMVFPEFRSGIVAVLPLYKRLPDGSRGEVYGAVTAALAAHEVIHAALESLHGGGVELHVHDADPHDGRISPLYIHGVGAPPPPLSPSSGDADPDPIPAGRHVMRVTQDVGGRTWIITAVPDHPLDAHSWEAWGVLGAGLLLTALAAMNVATTISRRDAERLVRERTAALADQVQRHERAQARLAESELRFRQFADNIDAVFWMVSGTPPRIEYVSPAFDRIWGQPASQLLQDRRRYFDSIHPDDRATVESLVAVQGKAPFDAEYRIVRPDGSVRWIRDRSVPIAPGPSGPRAAGIAEDITDRKRAEQALQDSEARQRAVLAAIPDCMFRMARDGACLDYHVPEGMPLPVPPDRFLGRRCEEVLPPAVCAPTLQAIEGALRTGQLHTFEYTDPGDDPRQWEVRVVPCGDDEVLAIVRDVSEQRRAQEALRASEARYRIVAEQTGQVIYDYAVASGDIVWAGAIQAVTGFTTEEFARFDIKGWASLLHPEDRDAVLAELDRVLRMGGHFRVEYRIRRADGRYATILDNGVLIDVGTPNARLLGAMKDITERVAAEEALRESEERYRLLAENATDMISRRTPDGVFLYASPACRALLGYEPEELLGRTIHDFADPADPLHPFHRSGQRLADAPAGGTSVVRTRVRRKDGQVVWLETTSRAVVNPATGAVQEIVAVSRDITERMNADRALRDSEERFRSLSTCSPVGIFMSTSRGSLTWVNPRLLEIAGLAYDEALGDGWATRVHPNDAPWLRQGWRRAAADARSFSAEFRFQHRTGDIRWVRATTSPMFADSGELVGHVGALEDITDRKLAEQALRDSEERYRRLVETSPDGIFVHQDGRVVFANAAAARLLGAPSPADLIGVPVSDLIHPSVIDEVRARLRRLADGAESVPPLDQKIVRLSKDTLDAEIAASACMYGGRPAVQVVARDITQRKAAEARLRFQASVLSQVDDAVIALDDAKRITYLNAAAARIYGVHQPDMIGRHISELYTQQWLRPSDEAAAFAELRARGRWEGLSLHVKPSGDRIYVESVMSTLRDDRGRHAGILAVVRDVSDRIRWEQRQSLMMAELDHRVKNNLAAVLSIADQTIRSSTSLADFGEAFTGRIRALARMHGVLAQSRWKGANLADLARQSLEAYMVGNGRRVFIDGPDVLLPARAASPVCMALHELATNAAKYGALSVPSGRVDIRWSLADPDPDAPDAPRRVELQWTESGGPPVAEPRRRGFGTELIEGGIAYELHGDVEIAFHPSGLACRMTIPLEDEPDRLTPPDPPAPPNPHANGAATT